MRSIGSSPRSALEHFEKLTDEEKLACTRRVSFKACSRERGLYNPLEYVLSCPRKHFNFELAQKLFKLMPLEALISPNPESGNTLWHLMSFVGNQLKKHEHDLAELFFSVGAADKIKFFSLLTMLNHQKVTPLEDIANYTPESLALNIFKRLPDFVTKGYIKDKDLVELYPKILLNSIRSAKIGMVQYLVDEVGMELPSSIQRTNLDFMQKKMHKILEYLVKRQPTIEYALDLIPFIQRCYRQKNQREIYEMNKASIVNLFLRQDTRKDGIFQELLQQIERSMKEKLPLDFELILEYFNRFNWTVDTNNNAIRILAYQAIERSPKLLVKLGRQGFDLMTFTPFQNSQQTFYHAILQSTEHSDLLQLVLEAITRCPSLLTLRDQFSRTLAHAAVQKTEVLRGHDIQPVGSVKGISMVFNLGFFSDKDVFGVTPYQYMSMNPNPLQRKCLYEEVERLSVAAIQQQIIEELGGTLPSDVILYTLMPYVNYLPEVSQEIALQQLLEWSPKVDLFIQRKIKDERLDEYAFWNYRQSKLFFDGMQHTVFPGHSNAATLFFEGLSIYSKPTDFTLTEMKALEMRSSSSSSSSSRLSLEEKQPFPEPEDKSGKREKRERLASPSLFGFLPISPVPAARSPVLVYDGVEEEDEPMTLSPREFDDAKDTPSMLLPPDPILVDDDEEMDEQEEPDFIIDADKLEQFALFIPPPSGGMMFSDSSGSLRRILRDYLGKIKACADVDALQTVLKNISVDDRLNELLSHHAFTALHQLVAEWRDPSSSTEEVEFQVKRARQG